MPSVGPTFPDSKPLNLELGAYNLLDALTSSPDNELTALVYIPLDTIISSISSL